MMSGWGRLADYLFGRNALIGVASFMLLIISGYATWHGMRDFIIGVSASPANQGSELPGGLSISNDVLVIAIVVALTFLMWLALRESFGAQRKWSERLIMFPLYVFLALWSIGFGYGFWWSLIAGEEATRTSLSGLQEDARDAGSAINARLEAVGVQIESVFVWSEGQMSREETSGGSCGQASGAGRGPLYNARRTVRDSIAGLRDSVNRSWLGPARTDLEAIQQTVQSLEGGTVLERQKFFETRAAEVRSKARGIASRSNELGKSTAAEMRAIAKAVAAAPGTAGFSCYDPTLADRLTQAADQADQPAVLTLREAAFNEGPAGVANAVKRLWANMGSYFSSLVAYVFTGGSNTGDTTAAGEPITGRDMIALLATIGIDLGLLALALLNPPAAGPIRHTGLQETQSQFKLPTGAVVRQLQSAIQTAIARAPDADLDWVRGHLIHHAGESYFVIPNVYSCDKSRAGEEQRALAINHLAGVFSDVKLIRPLSKRELQTIWKEEMRDSTSDLTPLRDLRKDGWVPVNDERNLWDRLLFRKPFVLPLTKEGQKRIRNHGVLSKAQRALGIAEWSEQAQRDVEVFRLVDTEGLTPLLIALNQGSAPYQDEAEEAAADQQKKLPKPADQAQLESKSSA